MSDQQLRLRGALTALITPFRRGAIDETALGRLVERQIHAGTTGLVACGSTGEAPALSDTEHARVVAIVAEAAGGRVPVIAGCGGASTEQACTLARGANASGAQALLCAPPPYVKPSQAGLLAHVGAVGRAGRLPIVLYDIPGRCIVAYTDETILRLVDTLPVIALKDASGDLTRPLRLRGMLGERITQLTGDDATASGYRAMGGDGCISVTANVTPGLCVQLHAAWEAGDLQAFSRLTLTLAPLHHALFLETNPSPVKAALHLLGMSTGEIRLPLLEAQAATIRALARCIADLKPETASLRNERPRRLRVVS